MNLLAYLARRIAFRLVWDALNAPRVHRATRRATFLYRLGYALRGTWRIHFKGRKP